MAGVRLGLVRPEGERVSRGLELGDVSEVCAKEGRVTSNAVARIIRRVFITRLFGEDSNRSSRKQEAGASEESFPDAEID
jgi:hypothetical protein